MSFKICRGTDGNHFAVTHHTAFTVRCGYLLPDMFLNATEAAVKHFASARLRYA